MPKSEASYYQGINNYLLQAVPHEAKNILEVGCAEGNLGRILKEQDKTRRVYGIEIEPEVAKRAATKLDQVFTVDVENEDVPLEPGSIDCILYGDVLEHLRNPEAVLRKHRKLLSKNGIILCSIPNIQHYSIVSALLRGDFQYTDSGLLDSTHIRFFTHSTFSKLLLDAGYEPMLVDIIESSAPLQFMWAVAPLIRYARGDRRRTQKYLGAYQYIFRGNQIQQTAEEETAPITFVACVSDEAQLEANLLRSACLQKGTKHELLLMRKCKNAAEGYNRALEQAKNDLVVFVHQDVYLPRGWAERFVQQVKLAEERFKDVAVFGVYGVKSSPEEAVHAGYVVDRDRVLHEGDCLPETVDTLDELLLAVRRTTDLRFEPSLGFHLYGADICLAAKQMGKRAVAVDALCFHNSLQGDLPDGYTASARTFARRWRDELPVWTSCSKITGGLLLPTHQIRSLTDKAIQQTEEFGTRLGSFWRVLR
jgi:SAM-dependent methyltransferase